MGVSLLTIQFFLESWRRFICSEKCRYAYRISSCNTTPACSYTCEQVMGLVSFIKRQQNVFEYPPWLWNELLSGQCFLKLPSTLAWKLQHRNAPKIFFIHFGIDLGIFWTKNCNSRESTHTNACRHFREMETVCLLAPPLCWNSLLLAQWYANKSITRHLQLSHLAAWTHLLQRWAFWCVQWWFEDSLKR